MAAANLSDPAAMNLAAASGLTKWPPCRRLQIQIPINLLIIKIALINLMLIDNHLHNFKPNVSYYEFMKLGIFTSSFHNCISDITQSLYLSTVIICCVVKLSLLKLPKSLTPHSSKDICTTYELIKLCNLPALFPNLVSDNTQKSELSLIRHCSTKLKK